MLKTQAKGTQIQTMTELRPLFAYELCAVCPALIYGQGCLRESNKPWLVKGFYIIYISWPHGGNTSDPVAFIEERLNNYPDATYKILLFDKYKYISAKGHERMRRASEVVIDHDLSISSHLDTCNYEKQIQ